MPLPNYVSSPKLSKIVFGEVRSCLVASYRKWKGMNDMPRNIHLAIRWKKNDPFLEDDIKDIKRHELQGKLKEEDGSPETGVDETATTTAPIKPNYVNHNESLQSEPEEGPWQPSTPACSKRKAAYVESMIPVKK